MSDKKPVAKKLVWRVDEKHDGAPSLWRADIFSKPPTHQAMFAAKYFLWPIGDGPQSFGGYLEVGFSTNPIPRRYFRGVKTLDAAKAACQRHFDDVVRSLMAGERAKG